MQAHRGPRIHAESRATLEVGSSCLLPCEHMVSCVSGNMHNILRNLVQELESDFPISTTQASIL